MIHDPNTPPTVRAFIAVELPEAAKAALAEPVRAFQAACGNTGLSPNWSRPDNWHLTLKFLGNVPFGQIASITERLAEAAKRHRPFTIHIEGFGAFPSPRRPRVLWIGLADDKGRAALIELAGAVEAAISPLGYPTEERDFHPHLTLARIPAPRLVPAMVPVLERSQRTRLPAVAVEQVALMRSELRRGGSVYTALANCALGG
ncbi:MAG: RNA 2',3'-cyclic phosphodiesterase [Nitrospirota bacterium]